MIIFVTERYVRHVVLESDGCQTTATGVGLDKHQSSERNDSSVCLLYMSWVRMGFEARTHSYEHRYILVLFNYSILLLLKTD